jgi:Winged helix-turn-helix DNA-binding
MYFVRIREQPSHAAFASLIVGKQRMMSPAVSDIRQHAETRLRELEPYLEEAAQLRQVIQILDGGNGSATRTDPNAMQAAERVAASPVVTNGRRAPQGANKRRILAVVCQHPGITAAEVARLTGLKRTVVASTMARLKRTGELEAHGRGARVAPEREAETLAILAA